MNVNTLIDYIKSRDTATKERLRGAIANWSTPYLEEKRTEALGANEEEVTFFNVAIYLKKLEEALR